MRILGAVLVLLCFSSLRAEALVRAPVEVETEGDKKKDKKDKDKDKDEEDEEDFCLRLG